MSKGIYFSLLAALISGISVFVNKFAVDAIKPALYFTSVKNFAVAVLLVALLLATKEFVQLKKLSKKELINLVLIGVVGGALPFYLFFTGLAQTSAINGALIQKTMVFWIALMAFPLLKEKLTKGQVLGIALLFTGNFIVGGFKGFKFSQGELMILAATILWAIENIIAKKVLATVSSNIVTAFRMGIGSVLLMTATFVTVPSVMQKSLSLSGAQTFWIGLTIISLFAYVTVWYKALKYTPAITASTILVSATLVTNVLSAIFITHSWNYVLTMQAVIMGLGIGLVLKSSRLETRAYEAR